MMRACAHCGEPTELYGRCEGCTASPVAQAPGRHPSKSSTARGYGTAWRKLSERARRAQPWCSACGSHDDLTCDHSPEAWERYLAGKPIRLVDVDVLCRRCNAEKGRARPSAPRTATRGVEVTSGGPTRWGEAKFASQMGTDADIDLPEASRPTPLRHVRVKAEVCNPLLLKLRVVHNAQPSAGCEQGERLVERCRFRATPREDLQRSRSFLFHSDLIRRKRTARRLSVIPAVHDGGCTILDRRQCGFAHARSIA